jgi:hypothetical protein
MVTITAPTFPLLKIFIHFVSVLQQFFLLRPIYDLSETGPSAIQDHPRAIAISHVFQSERRRLFEILQDGRLLFLEMSPESTEYWVYTVPLLPIPLDCTELPLEDAKIQRQFFLPAEWMKG